MKCIKFHIETGYIAVTNVPILNEDEILSYPVSKFQEVVTKKLEELVKDSNNNQDLIFQYEALGFDIPQRGLKAV